MDLSSLTLPQRAVLENLAHEDGYGSPQDWLIEEGFDTLSAGVVEYFMALDEIRHIYVGENDVDYGRRINCPRPGCKDIRGVNHLPGG